MRTPKLKTQDFLSELSPAEEGTLGAMIDAVSNEGDDGATDSLQASLSVEFPEFLTPGDAMDVAYFIVHDMKREV